MVYVYPMLSSNHGTQNLEVAAPEMPLRSGYVHATIIYKEIPVEFWNIMKSRELPSALLLSKLAYNSTVKVTDMSRLHQSVYNLKH